MARKKNEPAVPRINVNLDTGLSFTTGDQINPKWPTVRKVWIKLLLDGYGKHMLPPEIDPTDALTFNKRQIDPLVPLSIQNLDRAVSRGALDFMTDGVLMSCVWVLAWYWHLQLGGPRPLSVQTYQQKPRPVYGAVPELKCPWCGKIFDPPSNLVNMGPIYDSWVRWLKKHKSYHAFGARKPKVDSTQPVPLSVDDALRAQLPDPADEFAGHSPRRRRRTKMEGGKKSVTATNRKRTAPKPLDSKLDW